MTSFVIHGPRTHIRACKYVTYTTRVHKRIVVIAMFCWSTIPPMFTTWSYTRYLPRQ